MYPIRRAYKAVKKLFTRKRKSAKKTHKRKPVVNGIVSVCKIKQEDRDIVNINQYQAGTFTFELSDFPEYASYQSTYEYFRIDKVQVTWRALNNVAQTTGITPGTIFCAAGRIHSIIDYNDASAPTASRAGVSVLMQDNSYKCTSSMRNHTRTLVPRILMEGGGSSVGVVSKAKQWIPCGNTTASLSHFGIKYIMEGGYSTSALSYASFCVEPTIKLWVSFKDPQ